MEFNLRLPTRVSLTDLAADRLREAIVAGHFKLGERLVETRLSDSFGISRAPLREALRILAADGLVAIRGNRGTYVVSPSSEELESMVLARALAEGTAARLVAARQDADVLRRLETVLASQSAAQAAHDNRALIELHWRFHQTICEASGNQFLLDMWLKVSTVIRIYPSVTVHAIAVANNAVFLDALRSGDPAWAEELLRSQIIVMSYGSFGKPIPRAIRGYVTLYIGADNKVMSVRDFNETELAQLVTQAGPPRLPPPPGPHPSAAVARFSS